MFKVSSIKLTCLLLLCFIACGIRAATLEEVEDFGDNPGDITLYKYIPENMPAGSPLVVALHGCLQDAGIYSQAGWKQLADQWKFYVIFPEQHLTNNPYRCWNWFQAEETERGEGEIGSIASMVDYMKAEYGIDSGRIYVDGLSAGGWLTTVLLATYPDVFAGGATHAGGPAFCAHTERYFWDLFRWWNYYSAKEDAEECMEGEDKTPAEWRALVETQGFNDYTGPWPILSVWQGGEDDVVEEMNQQEIVEQWTALHGIDQISNVEIKLGSDESIIRREYRDSNNKTVVETYTLPELEHGIAISPGQACGETSDYVLDSGFCAVRLVGHFWGLHTSQK